MICSLFKIFLLAIVTLYLLVSSAFVEYYKNDTLRTLNNTYFEITNRTFFECDVFCVDQQGRPDLNIPSTLKIFLPQQYTILPGGKIYTFEPVTFSFFNLLWLPILNVLIASFIWFCRRNSEYTRVD